MHIVYAGDYYNPDYYGRGDKLRPFILNGMKEHKINSVMVTKIYMVTKYLERTFNVITKEKMESICRGEDNWRKHSVNDDLESLFENIRLGKEPEKKVETYFLPKLREEELIETGYSQPTLAWTTLDVKEARMMSSSDSKYVYGRSWRRTFAIENSTENSSETSSEKQSYLKNCCNCSLQ